MYLGRFGGKTAIFGGLPDREKGGGSRRFGFRLPGVGFHGGGETVLPMNPATTEAVAFLAHPAATTERRGVGGC